MNFDSIWATGKIIDYLVENDVILNEILKELPEYFYLKKEIPCKWSDKGNIMRRLTENRKEYTEQKEGIRFVNNKKGWVLIIPDEERPVINLYIEGYSKKYADELWIEYDQKIRNMIETQS